MPDPVIPSLFEIDPVNFGIGFGFVAKINFPDFDLTDWRIEIFLSDATDSEKSFAANSEDDPELVQIIPAEGPNPNYMFVRIPSASLSSLAVEGKWTDYAMDFRIDNETDPIIRIQGVVIWQKRGGFIDD